MQGSSDSRWFCRPVSAIVKGRVDRDDSKAEMDLQEPKLRNLSVDNLLITHTRGKATPCLSDSYLKFCSPYPIGRRVLSSGNQMLWQKLESVEIDHIEVGWINIHPRYSRVIEGEPCSAPVGNLQKM